MLQPKRREQLDANIKELLNNGGSNADVEKMAQDFVAKFGNEQAVVEKKNPNGTATTQKKSGESAQTIGSSGLPNLSNPLDFQKEIPLKKSKEAKETPSKFKEGTMSWNLEKLKKSNPEIETKFDQYKKAQQVPVDFVEKTKAEVEDAYNKKGFFNGLKEGLYKGINAIAYPTQVGLSGGKEPTPLIETDEFADERKAVNSRIKKEQLLAKSQKKSAPVYNQNQIDEMVKNERVNKLVKSQKESQVRSFLEDQDKSYTTDESGKTSRERLNIYNLQELSSLSEKDQENLKKQNVVLPALSNSMQKIKEYNEKIAKKTPLSAVEVEDYKNQFTKFEDLSNEASNLKKEFSTNREKIKDSKEALDLFKRDYSFARHIKNLEASTKELASGIAGFGDYLFEGADFVADKLGTPKPSVLAMPVKDLTKGVSQDLTKESNDLRSETAKQIRVEDINSFDDLGSWLGDTAVSQAPVFAMIATGAPGVVALGSSSTGQKYESMVDENSQTPNKFSKGQLLGIPAIYGASEILSASVDYYLLKNASKVYSSVGKPERKMIVDGMAKKILETSGNVAKSAVLEAGDEMFTQGVQNFADIYIGGDKSKKMTDGMVDAGVAGAVMGAFINIAPLAVEKATKPFSKNDDTQKTASEIMSLQMQLDNKGLSENSRKVIEEQLEKAKTKLNTQLEKRVVDLKTLSNAQFKEINLIERTQANIKQKAVDIKSDNSIDANMKKQILKNLESEFNANEQRRVDLLERGASVQLEKLSDDEKQKYQEKANRVLAKEKNPDGTKENVKINQEELDKKAIELYKIDQLKIKSESNEQAKTEVTEPIESQPQAEVETKVTEVSSAISELEKQRDAEIEALKSKRQYDEKNITPIREKYDALIVKEKAKETEAKIKRKDLFQDGGTFSNQLGESGVDSVPTNHQEINGIEFVEFSNPNTGVVDVIMSGTSDSDFVGYYRVYENGKPTEKWSSKFENQSRNKENFKTMISGVQSMLPKGHLYTEKTSISTDGLRVWEQQLSRGYEMQTDNNGNIVTNEVAINGDAINNELGIDVNQGNFDNISVTNNQQFETVKKALIPYLEKLGLTEQNIRWENGTVFIDLPVLKSKTSESNNNQINNADNYLGTPTVTQTEDGDLYEFKTKDGIIAGVMVSPTEFRIDGISANEIGKGMGSKMFENLIDHLKNKGVDTITTKSAGEGAVKMHQKAVDKGLLTEVSKNGREATFNINKNETTSPSNTPTDGNVSVGTESMEQVGIEEKPTVEVDTKESVQSANDVKPIEGKTQVDYALEQIDKGVLQWNGDINSPRIDLGMSWADIRKGEADLKRGKIDSVPAKRLLDAFENAKKEGGYRYKMGTGSENKRSAEFVTFEDLQRANNEIPLTDAEIEEINQNEEKLVQEYYNSFDKLTEEEQNEILENYEGKTNEQTKVGEDTEIGNSKNDVSNEEETARNFKREKGKSSVLKRIREGGNSEEINKIIDKIGLNYKGRKQEQVYADGVNFVKEVGVAEAYNAIKSGELKDSDTINVVYATILQEFSKMVENEISKVSDPQELNELMNELDDLHIKIYSEFKARTIDAGRGSAIFNFIYNQDLKIKYSLSQQIENFKNVNNGIIPEEVLAKMKELDKKHKEANKRVEELESLLKEAQEQNDFENIIEEEKRQPKTIITVNNEDILKYSQEDFDRELQKAKDELGNDYNISVFENLKRQAKKDKLSDKKEDLKSSKAKVLEDIRKVVRDSIGQISVNPLAKPFEFATLVTKLAKIHIQEGALSLEEVANNIYNDLKDISKDISKESIFNILKSKPKRVMSEATKRKIYINLLKKNIASLDAQIETKKRDVITRVDKYKNDFEIKDLRDKRTEKRDELAKVDPSYAESRKLATDLKLAQKSLDEYQRRIDENDLTPKEKEPKAVAEKLKKLREKRDAKRKEFLAKKKKYDDSLKPVIIPPTEEELADKKYLNDVNNKINSLTRRIDDLKANKPKSNDRKSTVWNKEISELENKLNTLKESRKVVKEKSAISEKEKALKEPKQPKVTVDKNGKVRIPTEMIKDFISKGGSDLSEFATQVKESIKDEFPDVSVRDIRESVANYGKKANKSRPQIVEDIQKLKSEERLRLEYEDLQNRISKEKNEVKKQSLSQTERRLKAQIKQLQDDLGITESERTNRSVNYTKKRIETLKEKIKNNDFAKKEVKPIVESKELRDAKIEKNRVQEEFDYLSYEQEIKNRTFGDKAKEFAKDIYDSQRVTLATGEMSFVGAQGGFYMIDSTFSRKTLENLIKNFKGTTSKEWRANPFGTALKMIKSAHSAESIMKMFSTMGTANNYIDFQRMLKEDVNYDLYLKSGLRILGEDVKSQVKDDNFIGNNILTLLKIPIHLIDRIEKQELKKLKLSFAETEKKRTTLQGFYEKLKTGKISDKNKKTATEIFSNANPLSTFERGNTVFMNMARIEMFNKYAYGLYASGKNPTDHLAEFKKLGSAINTITGSGNMSQTVTMALPVLNKVMFSARYFASSWNLTPPFSLYYLAKLGNYDGVEINSPSTWKNLKPTVAQKAFVKPMVKGFVAFYGLSLMTMAMINASIDDDDEMPEEEKKKKRAYIEYDPRSSNFMQVISGNVRTDFFGPYRGNVVLLSKLLSGKSKNKQGEIVENGGEYGSRTDFQIGTEYLAGKANPFPGMFIRYSQGKKEDVLNLETGKVEEKRMLFDKEIGIGYQMKNNMLPIFVTTVKDITNEDPVLGAAFYNSLALFGKQSSVYKDSNTFENKQAKLAKEYILERQKPLETITQETAKSAIKSAEGDIVKLEEFIKVQKKNPSTPYYISKDVRWTSKDLSIEDAQDAILDIKEAIKEAKIKYNVK